MNSWECDPSFTIVREGVIYSRSPPSIAQFVSKNPFLLHWLYSKVTELGETAPAEGYLTLRNVWLYGGAHIVQETASPLTGAIPYWHSLADVDPIIQGLIQREEFTPIPPADVPTVAIAQESFDNYGHFVCEAAPKLLNIARAGLRRIRLLLPEEAGFAFRFVQEVLRFIGIDAEIFVLRHAWVYKIEDMLWFTPVAEHDHRKSPTLVELRDVALKLFGGGGPPRRRLLVSRGTAYQRRLSNQEAVSAAFAAEGYETIDPGGMTMEEQIRLFSEADSVVGAMGAGMTNILFTPRGTDVLYISNGLLDRFFWDIACLCHLHFLWFFAAPPREFSLELHAANFEVDLPPLLAAHRAMIAARNDSGSSGEGVS